LVAGFEFYPVSVASAPGRFGELRQVVFIRSILNATRRRLVCRPDHRCGTTVRSFNRRVHLLSASPALLRFQQEREKRERRSPQILRT